MPRMKMPAPADFGGEPEKRKSNESQPALRVVRPDETKAPAPAPAAKGRISLGGLAKGGSSKKKETVHPVAPASEELAALVEQFCQEKPVLDQLEGSVKTLRKQILEKLAPEILSLPGAEYSMIANGPAPESAASVQSKILVTLQNRYTGIDYATGWDQMAELIGLEKTEENFTQGVSIKLDMGKVPDHQRQALLDRLLPIFQEFGLTEAAEGEEEPAVVAKEVLVPKPDFHAMRRARLTKEENAKVQELLPAVGLVKLKNVRR